VANCEHFAPHDWSRATVPSASPTVRFASIAGIALRCREPPHRATKRLLHRSRRYIYSITSSAMASSVGALRPGEDRIAADHKPAARNWAKLANTVSKLRSVKLEFHDGSWRRGGTAALTNCLITIV
jgi:hypothetical protein